MPFTAPETVTSPKGSVSNLRVLLNTGEHGWSLAAMRWEDRDALGIRWNGHAGNPLGNPQSRGIPTWFILPDELAATIRVRVGDSMVGAASASTDISRVKIRPLPRRIWRGEEQEQIDDEWLFSITDRATGAMEIQNPRTGHFIRLHRSHVKELLRDPISDKPNGPRHALMDLSVQIVLEDGNLRLEPIRNFTDRIEALFADIWEVGPERQLDKMRTLIEECRGDIAGRKGALGPWETELLDFADAAVQNNRLLRLALTSVQKAWLVSQLPSDEYNFGYNYSSPTL
jgi:hypothetical protein